MQQNVIQSGQLITIVTIDISPNQNVQNIISFVRLRLLPYIAVGDTALGEVLDQIRVILAGDLNFNFVSDYANNLFSILGRQFCLKIHHVTLPHAIEQQSTHCLTLRRKVRVKSFHYILQSPQTDYFLLGSNVGNDS